MKARTRTSENTKTYYKTEVNKFLVSHYDDAVKAACTNTNTGMHNRTTMFTNKEMLDIRQIYRVKAAATASIEDGHFTLVVDVEKADIYIGKHTIDLVVSEIYDEIISDSFIGKVPSEFIGDTYTITESNPYEVKIVFG